MVDDYKEKNQGKKQVVEMVGQSAQLANATFIVIGERETTRLSRDQLGRDSFQIHMVFGGQRIATSVNPEIAKKDCNNSAVWGWVL